MTKEKKRCKIKQTDFWGDFVKNIFDINSKCSVTEANINFYANPFVHPKRVMREYDFIYMLQGEWKLGQNDEVFDLKKDSLLILTANNCHFGISPCSANTKTMYFHVLCEESITDDSICVESLTDVSLNKAIKKCFLNIVNSKLSHNQIKSDLYFKLLLCELKENNMHTSDSNIATKIITIIHNNPEKFFTNKELADMINVSVKTAENKFKAMYDTTIHQYILDFKINEAISYFEKFPEISIKETAYNLGFYDEYHFSKQFKKTTGLSPKEYRNK